METAEKILVIKLSALGDFILALGAMKAIRRHHPSAHITLLTTRPFVDIASRSGYFNDIIIDPRPKLYELQHWYFLFQRFNQGGFARVYDLQMNDRTKRYYRLFLKKPEWSGVIPGSVLSYTAPGLREMHAFKRHQEVLKLAGIEAGLPEVSWMTSDVSLLNVKKPYVLLIPGSAPARPEKRWPAIRYGALALKLMKDGYQVAVINISRLRKIIREYNVDVVHACSRAPAWSAGRAVQGTSARYVTSCHAAHKMNGPLKKLYNSSVTKGERVIAVSHFLADHLEQHYSIEPERLRVVQRGVAIERFHPNSVTHDRLIKIAQQWRIPDGASVIMLPGRISRIKGHMFLIDALQQLAQKDVFCLFVGSSDGNETYRKELEAYIASKGLEGQVRMVSHCDDMPAAYMIATVVAVPSLVPEGFGRTVVEAQAMGRPVIATDHGGQRETILRDETGWLVTPGDVQGFSDALFEAVSLDARQRAILGTRAMNHVVQHFTNDQMCAATLDVYAELLESATLMRALPSNDAFRADPSRRIL